MADFLCRMTLRYTTGLPRDVAVNTFAFTADSIADNAIGEAFIAFYNADNGLNDGIYEFMSPILDRTPGVNLIEFCEINAAAGTVSEPIGTGEWGLTPTSNTASLPLETAVCTSFHAALPGPETVNRRRRGRVYIGPLNPSAIQSSGGLPNVVGPFQQSLSAATNQLADALIVAGANLCVWSRADAALFPVVGGWVDNEFDNMRSREVEATSRDSWAL